MKQHTVNKSGRRGFVRRAAGVAAIALLAVACSGSDDEGESEVSAPASDASAVSAAETSTTVAPVVTDPPTTESAVEPAEIPDLPCADYLDESGYPLTPCDSGPLVETLQRNLASLFPSIVIDGLFGSQTSGFVTEFQASNALEETGLVSEELAGQIEAAEALGELVEESGAAEADAAEDGASEDGVVDDATEELCTDLIGNANDPNFTAGQIEACSALGIDIVGEG